MPLRQLQLEGVRRDELGPHEHGAEDDLQALEKVLAHNDHGGGAARNRRLARTQRPDEGRRGVRRRRQSAAAAGVRGVGAARAAAVLRVVVDEHGVGGGEQGAVHAYLGGEHDLEAAHVARVARVLQAVLVALEEELEEESGGRGRREAEESRIRAGYWILDIGYSHLNRCTKSGGE